MDAGGRGCYDEFQVRGVWWVPGDEGRLLHGTLDYSPRRMRLSLAGSFGKPTVRSLLAQGGDAPRYPAIRGVGDRGEGVTLRNCWQEGVHGALSGPHSEEISATEMYVGRRRDYAATGTLGSVRVGTTCLGRWLGISGFSGGFLPEGDGAMIWYERPRAIEHRTGDGPDLAVSFDFVPSFASRDRPAASITQVSSVEIRPRGPMPLGWFAQQIRHLNAFLSLAMLEPSYAVRVEGPAEPGAPLGGARALVYSADVTMHGMLDARRRIPEVPLPYSAIGGAFGDVYGRWLASRPALDPVYDLYSGTVYMPGMYLDVKLLNLIQAAESFHRITGAGIFGKPEGPRGEPSLRQRLEYLASGLPGAIAGRMDGGTICELVDVRNYYSHYDQSKRPRLPPDERQHELARVAAVAVEACMLGHAGVDEGAVSRFAGRSMREKSLRLAGGGIPPPE